LLQQNPSALGKSIDVGLDSHDFAPQSWKEITAYMAGRPHDENLVGPKASGT
jgi:hypothetical protein